MYAEDPGDAPQLLEHHHHARLSVVGSSFIQPTVAVNSCETELSGFFEAALWLELFRRIVALMGVTQQGPDTVYADSASAIAVLNKRVPSGRSKHYDVRYLRINESIDRAIVAHHSTDARRHWYEAAPTPSLNRARWTSSRWTARQCSTPRLARTILQLRGGGVFMVALVAPFGPRTGFQRRRTPAAVSSTRRCSAHLARAA